MHETATQHKKQQPALVQAGIGVLLVRDHKLLLGKRVSGHGLHQWGPPGGKPEFGERFVDAAIREVYEETGIRVHDVHPFRFIDSPFLHEGVHFASLLFYTHNFTGDASIQEPEKHEAWQWFAFEDIPQPLFVIEEIRTELTTILL